MELQDLLGTPNNLLTDDQLEDKLYALRQLRGKKITNKTSKSSKVTSKSNKDKQIENLLKQLTPEQLKIFMQGMNK